MYTVKQISNKYHISKVSIYKHIKALNKNGKYNHDIKHKKNKVYLNQHLINDLINSFDKSHVSKAKSSLNANSQEVKTLKEAVKGLKFQNSNLIKALLNEQELNRETNEKLISDKHHGWIYRLFH